jgi:hypothetical protein
MTLGTVKAVTLSPVIRRGLVGKRMSAYGLGVCVAGQASLCCRPPRRSRGFYARHEPDDDISSGPRHAMADRRSPPHHPRSRTHRPRENSRPLTSAALSSMNCFSSQAYGHNQNYATSPERFELPAWPTPTISDLVVFWVKASLSSFPV